MIQTNTPSKSPKRLAGLDALRGIAALAVVWYHMTHGGELLQSSAAGWPIAAAAMIAKLGHHGVTLFFVLSGFVIPWSLQNQIIATHSNSSVARLASFIRFFVRRFLRLQPPFLAACIITLALNWLSSRTSSYTGTWAATPTDLAISLASDNLFITSLLGKKWILVVAWTLALEIQFYFLAGLAEPFLSPMVPNKAYQIRLLIAISAMAVGGYLIPQPNLIFRSLPIFAVGWLLAHRTLKPHRSQLFGLAISLLLINAWAGPEAMAMTLLSMALLLLAIHRPHVFPRQLMAVGTISYSLYLIHVPIGGRMINLFSRFQPNTWQWLVISLLAGLISLVAAWVFYRLVEVPSQKLSRRASFWSKPLPSNAPSAGFAPHPLDQQVRRRADHDAAAPLRPPGRGG